MKCTQNNDNVTMQWRLLLIPFYQLCNSHLYPLPPPPNPQAPQPAQNSEDDDFHFITALLNTPHCEENMIVKAQGPVVQSVISLTSLLRVISLTVLADSIYNILIFFAAKMWVAFALQKLLTFFRQKVSAYLRITQCKF